MHEIDYADDLRVARTLEPGIAPHKAARAVHVREPLRKGVDRDLDVEVQPDPPAADPFSSERVSSRTSSSCGLR